MRRLAGATEHLDGELSDGPVLSGNLRDLRRINRLLGGVALSVHAVDALVREGGLVRTTPLGLLDVGTGAADIPIALIRRWEERGGRMSVMGIDSRPEVLAAAGDLWPDRPGPESLALRVADGRAMPFDDDAFDVAHASLVLHHLEPVDAAAMIREMARVARHGVVLNDLARGWLPWLGAWILLRLGTRNRYTLHDGPLSVRRAHTRAEARQMLTTAGLRIVHEETAILGHRWVIAARPA